MRVEYGAATVFRVERRNGRVMVEGWDGSRRCRLEKAVAPDYITRYSVERSEGAEKMGSLTPVLSCGSYPSSAKSNVTTSQSSDTHLPLTGRYTAVSSDPWMANRID
jgi:hypothetical protein